MKKNLTILIFCLAAIISFDACKEKDDGTIRFYTSFEYPTTPITKPQAQETNEFTTDSRKLDKRILSVEIRGGDGNYTFKSSNQDIIEDASIYVDYHSESGKRKFVFFTVLKEGETFITATDGNGVSSAFKVTVSSFVSMDLIFESRLVINDEVSQSVRQEIETDIADNHLKPLNNIHFTYSSELEGSFVIYQGNKINEAGEVEEDESSHDVRFDGAFTIKKNNSDYMVTFNLTYNGQTQQYNICGDEMYQLGWGASFTRLYGIDLTEYYKKKYPNENITQIYYALNIL